MVDDLKALTQEQTTLVIGTAEKYIPDTVDVLNELLKSHDHGAFVTVNQPYSVISKLLEKRGVDISKLFFIDCITKQSGGHELTDNCLFISSPAHLTELSIGIAQALQHLGDGKHFVFIDSIGTFLIYNSAGTMSMFNHMLINKIALAGADAIIMSVEDEMDKQIISELRTFCAQTITLK